MLYLMSEGIREGKFTSVSGLAHYTDLSQESKDKAAKFLADQDRQWLYKKYLEAFRNADCASFADMNPKLPPRSLALLAGRTDSKDLTSEDKEHLQRNNLAYIFSVVS